MVTHPETLPERSVVFVFEALREGPIGDLRFIAEDVAMTGGEPARQKRVLPARLAGDLVVPAGGTLTSSDAQRRASGPRIDAALVGSGPFLYGDVNGDGFVNVVDVAIVSDGAVGLRTLIGDAFVVGNVAPANVGSSVPVGSSTAGVRVLSVLDVVPISEKSVGLAVPVVGTQVPAARVGPRLLVTPSLPSVATIVPACQARVAASAPFADAAKGRAWPECIDALGRQMVVQFCAYQKTTTGSWVAQAVSVGVPRCDAELPVLQRGGV